MDRKVATLASELAEAIVVASRLRALDRLIHRREHLDEIERVISLR